MTTLKNMHEVENRIPFSYATLLQLSCEGHALWNPRSCEDGGGNIGDIGNINGGVFGKRGDVYAETGGLMFDAGQYMTTERVNGAFKSSAVFAAQFGPQMRDALPPGVAPGSVASVEFLLKSSGTPAACLVLAGESHVVVDALHTERDRLQAYLAHNYERLQATNGPKVVILHYTLKASGWLGGLATTSAATTGEVSVPAIVMPALNRGWSSPSDGGSASEHASLVSVQRDMLSQSDHGSNTSSPRPASAFSNASGNVGESSVFLRVTISGIVEPEHITSGPPGWNLLSPKDQTVVVGYVKGRKRYRVKAAVRQALRIFSPNRTVGPSQRQQTSKDSVGDRTHIGCPEQEQERGPVKEDAEQCDDALDFILSAALDAHAHVDLMVGSSDLVSAYYELPAYRQSLDKIDFVIQTETTARGETVGYIRRICPKVEETPSPLSVFAEAPRAVPLTPSNDHENPTLLANIGGSQARDVPMGHWEPEREHTKVLRGPRGRIPDVCYRRVLSIPRSVVVS